MDINVYNVYNSNVDNVEYRQRPKRGAATPFEFMWFAKTFPQARLAVINLQRFESRQIRGLTIADFLRQE